MLASPVLFRFEPIPITRYFLADSYKASTKVGIEASIFSWGRGIEAFFISQNQYSIEEILYLRSYIVNTDSSKDSYQSLPSVFNLIQNQSSPLNDEVSFTQFTGSFQSSSDSYFQTSPIFYTFNSLLSLNSTTITIPPPMTSIPKTNYRIVV